MSPYSGILFFGILTAVLVPAVILGLMGKSLRVYGLIATVLMRFMGFGPMGVWIGMFCDWTVRAVIYIFRFRSGRWATKKVIRN